MENIRPRYQNHLFDSARWDRFEFRDGDIVICTPAKCGTTWTQMICALLIFQTPQLEKPLSEYSPWLDMHLRTEEDVFSLLSAQAHRRFIKTHTPLDGLPIDPRASYICVGRDPRDAMISLTHHGENMNSDVFREVITRVTGSPPPPREEPEVPETVEERFWKWVDNDDPVTESRGSLKGILHYYQEAFVPRPNANVIVMHYADMKADLETEMRRLATGLGITVPESLWPALVNAAKFDQMREHASQLAPDAQKGVWKEDRNFFYSGSNGYWKEFFSDSAHARYFARAEALASPNLLLWAHNGTQRQDAP